jgi:hypothetical protein
MNSRLMRNTDQRQEKEEEVGARRAEQPGAPEGAGGVVQ